MRARKMNTGNRYEVKKLTGKQKLTQHTWDQESKSIVTREVERSCGYLVTFPAGHSIHVQRVDTDVLGHQSYQDEFDADAQ